MYENNMKHHLLFARMNDINYVIVHDTQILFGVYKCCKLNSNCIGFWLQSLLLLYKLYQTYYNKKQHWIYVLIIRQKYSINCI